MDKLPLSKKHGETLAEYGLQSLFPDACTCMLFHPGEAVTREGMPITWLSVIISGKAKICSTAPNGKNLVLCYYVSDGLIGDLELMTGLTTATTTVVAITDFECISVSLYPHRAFLKSNAVFLNRLGNELAIKLLRSSDSFVSFALYSGEERLCSYILQTSHHNIFSDILTDVSCSVGMSYRHMFRLLNQLCEEAILEKRESGYHILDRDALIRRSQASHAPHRGREQADRGRG